MGVFGSVSVQSGSDPARRCPTCHDEKEDCWENALGKDAPVEALEGKNDGKGGRNLFVGDGYAKVDSGQPRQTIVAEVELDVKGICCRPRGPEGKGASRVGPFVGVDCNGQGIRRSDIQVNGRLVASKTG